MNVFWPLISHIVTHSGMFGIPFWSLEITFWDIYKSPFEVIKALFIVISSKPFECLMNPFFQAWKIISSWPNNALYLYYVCLLDFIKFAESCWVVPLSKFKSRSEARATNIRLMSIVNPFVCTLSNDENWRSCDLIDALFLTWTLKTPF